ncbi:MAG: GntR family transcriptional regulator, partial [Bifidobacterium tibiigranuli]|uniref:hypothetical protein n=1 Tax=Bifidobacterium tibiigranuli TaxID=2172043 RepID=UPI002354BB24
PGNHAAAPRKPPPSQQRKTSTATPGNTGNPTPITTTTTNEFNEGVQRIYTDMQQMFLNEPVYSEPGKTKVQLTLENSITSRVLHNQDSLEQRLSKEILSTLSGYEIAAVQMAYTKKRVTVRELCDYLGRTPKTLRPALRELVDKGIFRWHGSGPWDPSQYYALD